MKYLINKKSDKPIYIQIYEQIRQHITNNSIKYGEGLSSKRFVSEELGISVIPVFNSRVWFCSYSVPVFEQLVLADFISSGNFKRHINGVRRRKRKDIKE